MTDTLNLPTLRRGSRRSVSIAKLLRWLVMHGYKPTSRANGRRFTKTIEGVVKRFQAQHLDADGRPLAVDGIVGPKTWGSLLRPVDDDQRLGLGDDGGTGEEPRDPRLPCAQETGAGQLLATALSDYDAGRCEIPMGSNCCPWLEPRAQGKPWCSFQVHAWVRYVLGEWIFGGRRGNTRMDLREARGRGMLVRGPRPGDVFILCDDAGVPYHTGVVLRLSDGFLDGPPNPAMNTVEGNCANRVAIRERPITPQVVFWRPFPGDLDWTPGLLPNAKRAGGESTR